MKKNIILLFSVLMITSCQQPAEDQTFEQSEPQTQASKPDKTGDSIPAKPVIYQMLPRIFGNTNTTNKPWGTIEENGVGKFNDINDNALQSIKSMGVDYIWYTGIPHHAVIRDYRKYGISNDDPDVVKGRAGSPYAVKDYYQVDPDLAVDVSKRREEFKALIERTHKANLKVIIDIVPNHVARDYHSLSAPKGIDDFGAKDDTSVVYKRDNNFYYVPGKAFKVPEWRDGYQPLGGEKHPLADGVFNENPAKWTGNGSRSIQPDQNDWYETVKINYGFKPDGSFDFPQLPQEYASKNATEHFEFWQNKSVPDSWLKFRDICLFWLDFGVDGFRYDTAELVPVEFWSFLNSSIKNRNPNALLIAEVYNPKTYRDFIFRGKMDLLYDKVDFYDRMRAVMEGKADLKSLSPEMTRYADIDEHMLHFLENHDEQRIASSAFAKNARIGIPAMAVSALFDKGANMLFYAQELGEKAEQDLGFGDPTRTSIFDYQGLDKLARWNNGGKFSDERLTKDEKYLRNAYSKILNVSRHKVFKQGKYIPLTLSKKHHHEKVLAFARSYEENGEAEVALVVANFSARNLNDLVLNLSRLTVNHNYVRVDKTLFDSKATLNSALDEIHLASLKAYGVEITFLR